MWSEVIPPLVATLRERSGEIAAGMTERIRAELPEVIADPDDAETNRASNEANLRLVAELLERGADPQLAELPEPTIAYAEVGAHQNTPLTGLLRAYRVGHEYGWREILEILREQVGEPASFAQAVELVSLWLFAYVDAATCLAEELYARERERWLRTASASRAETIDAILREGPIEAANASARLGYELERTHLGIVAWLDPGTQAGDPIGLLEGAVGEAAASIGLERPLIHPLGLAVVAAWLGSREPLGPGAAAEIGLGSEPSSAARLATGTPGEGIEGFRRSHGEALQARRVSTLVGGPPGVVTPYASVELIAIATADLHRAGCFVRRRLGGLAGADPTSLRLAATLRAYLDEGASHGRAATRLGIHENTVRYRVRQAEDLLGRPVASGDLELRVALALLEASPAFAADDA